MLHWDTQHMCECVTDNLIIKIQEQLRWIGQIMQEQKKSAKWMSERCTQCKWQVTWTGALYSLSQLSPMPWSLTEPETTYLVDAPVKEENES